MTTELDVAVIVIYSPVTMELAGKHVLVTSAAAAAVAAAFHDVSDRLDQ